MIRTLRTITGWRAYLVDAPCVCREAATEAAAIAALMAWLQTERAA
jgi:hypothetical protein